MQQYSVQPGDVVVVRTDGFAARLIRFGEMLQGKPDLDNHVAVVYRTGPGGILAIEGRPGGVGWVDAARYLASPGVLTNAAQPKTPGQRLLICRAMREMVLKRTPYDWHAIADDTASAFRIPDPFREASDWGKFPGHVVCSSVAAWAYEQAAVTCPAPNDMAHCEPADWTAFIEQRAWLGPGADLEGKDLHSYQAGA